LQPVKSDIWLSSLLGRETFHLSGNFSNLNLEVFPQRAFLDAKAGVENVEATTQLQNCGFRLIDTNVQLIRAAKPFRDYSNRCRFATPSDENAIRSIARSSFSRTRFHLDPLIPTETANLIKEEWAANYFKGSRGEWMVVAEEDNKIVAFLQLLKKNQSTLVIDLIAVDQSSQRRGYAGAMISFAYNFCTSNEPEMIVGTQISNINSLGVYINLGFRITSAQYVFHWHKNGI